MKILVTAFEPFGGESINSALETMKLLPQYIGNIQIVKREIPTVFRKSIQEVWKAMEQEHPDLVISLGQAGGRNCISVERIAINVDDAGIPDNEGNQPMDKPIFEDGENAYFSTLPIKDMINAINMAGIHAEVSNSAGTYVCNHLMYGVLYRIHKDNMNIKAGFIHVPYIPEQVANKPGIPSLPLNDIVTGIKSCLLLFK
ncbi:MAG TPA: pyroglutamyl-peptidase I [Clostridiales bacterium]|nr:pyroglutamyl-peptidase I [Clostridiales bacterium]